MRVTRNLRRSELSNWIRLTRATRLICPLPSYWLAAVLQALRQSYLQAQSEYEALLGSGKGDESPRRGGAGATCRDDARGVDE